MQPPRLLAASSRAPPNVAVVSGFPWFFSEADATREFSRFGVPKVVRLYENPINGSSRGIVYVEFDDSNAVMELHDRVDAVGPYPVTVRVYHLSHTNWNRSGKLPDLPEDELSSAALKKMVEGFGPEGYAVRGVSLGLPNTVLDEDVAQIETIRKRLRTE